MAALGTVVCTVFQERLYKAFRHHCTERSVRTPDTSPFIRRSLLQICIIKLTFRNKHDPRSIQIIRLEKHAQNNRLLSHLCPGDFY